MDAEDAGGCSANIFDILEEGDEECIGKWFWLRWKFSREWQGWVILI
jgi:hypothetical protein